MRLAPDALDDLNARPMLYAGVPLLVFVCDYSTGQVVGQFLDRYPGKHNPAVRRLYQPLRSVLHAELYLPPSRPPTVILLCAVTLFLTYYITLAVLSTPSYTVTQSPSTPPPVVAPHAFLRPPPDVARLASVVKAPIPSKPSTSRACR